MFGVATLDMEEKVTAVGEELRPTVGFHDRIHLRYCSDDSAAGGDAKNCAAQFCEDDAAVCTPRAPERVRNIREHLRGSSGDGNFLKLSFGKKTDPAAVQRPKRKLGLLRPGQWAGCHLIDGTQPDHGIGSG